MFKKHASLFVSLAAVLILAFAVNQPAMAMGGYAGDQVGKGLIRSIDYQHHSITVNGHTYAVSPAAKFSGIAGFSVLSIGMPIQFMLSATAGSVTPGDAATTHAASSQPQVIVGITWLPGGIK